MHASFFLALNSFEGLKPELEEMNEVLTEV